MLHQARRCCSSPCSMITLQEFVNQFGVALKVADSLRPVGSSKTRTYKPGVGPLTEDGVVDAVVAPLRAQEDRTERPSHAELGRAGLSHAYRSRTDLVEGRRGALKFRQRGRIQCRQGCERGRRGIQRDQGLRAHGTPDAHWPRRADAHAPRISVDARGSEVPSAASSRISLSSVRLAIARFSRAFSVSNSFR